MEYKSTEEAIGVLFLSGYWGALKGYEVELFATVMHLGQLTPREAVEKFKPDWDGEE